MNHEGLHLETSDVAAYLDRVLTDVERDRVEAHLATCAECRREVVEVSRLKRRGNRARWLLVVPAAAAAVLAIVLLRPGDTGKPVLRDDGTGGALARVIIVAPAESVSAATRPHFVWRAAGADASYRFTLSDASGDVLWSATASDTTLLLPPELRLQPARTYFWYVDALVADGRSASSGVRRLALIR